jgi:predicted negative regulator of RcsB-dependent stress response
MMSLWTFKVLCYLKRHKILIGGLILIILAILGVSIYNSHQVKKPVLLKQEQVKDPVKLANAIHITKDEAQQVVSNMETAQPVTTYYVQAPTVEQAAKQTQQAIKRDDPALPKAATEKSDRTAVVPNTEEQKVDVYKIKLDKPHSILAGVTVMTNGEVYETVGYEDKRFEGLAHFKGSEFKGASALVKVMRW